MSVSLGCCFSFKAFKESFSSKIPAPAQFKWVETLGPLAGSAGRALGLSPPPPPATVGLVS